MLRALLFDLDGTLVNTDPIHYRAWQEILSNFGVEIDPIIYEARFSGKLNPAIVKDMLPHLSDSEGELVAETKEARFRELAGTLKPVAGLEQLLTWAAESGLKLGLVTNAPPENVDFMLSTLGLTKTFDTVVLAAQLKVGKPDPFPYQIALQQLEITPEQAIAFEDSPTGVMSAVRAKILTVGIASVHNEALLKVAGALEVVPNFVCNILWNLLGAKGVNEGY